MENQNQSKNQKLSLYTNKNHFLFGDSRGYTDGPQCFHSSTDITSVLLHVTWFFVYFHFRVTVRTVHTFTHLQRSCQTFCYYLHAWVSIL